MSRTSVDFPEPDTPVMATKLPSGISTVRSLRLCCRAPCTSSRAIPGGRRLSGTGIVLRPDRYCPVIDSLTLVSPDTGPL